MSNPEPDPRARQLRPMTPLELQTGEDLDWALDHFSELVEQYPGEYLVVWKKQVVTHGTDPHELLRQATAPERPWEELVLVAFPDPFADIPH